MKKNQNKMYSNNFRIIGIYPLVFIVLLLMSSTGFAQTFKVERVNGTVKAQMGVSEEFVLLTEGMMLERNTLLLTEKNATLSVSGDGIRFTLKPSAAVNLSDLRKMTLEELLLALALEEILDAGTKREKGNLKNTAIYGSESTQITVKGNYDLGLLKLNGAMQLAESGFTGTSIVVAKDAFRKFPSTAGMSNYRIFFAEQMMKVQLWNEALAEFGTILNMSLTAKEKQSVTEKINLIKQQLSVQK